MQSYRCIIFRLKLLPQCATWNSDNDGSWLPFSHWAENLELCFSEVPIGNHHTVEETPADVGLPLPSLSSPSTLQRTPVPSVCHTTICIGAFQSILVFLCLWHILIIFWGLLIFLFQFKGTKRTKRLCQSLSEQCFSSIIFCALCSYKGVENKAGSEAVRTIPLPEKNNNDVVHFHETDLEWVSWWSYQCILVLSWN